ncbi:MAG: protein kinase domain-containing protein [Planctomycetota bacterium]|jgi:formylglycine-generating enzyme required for sulfatase activity/predicted Ser/Thr protein kinase
MPPRIWGDYEVEQDSVLGRGGMGTVYRGRQVSLDRIVALKVLRKDFTDSPDFVKRFHREASLLARLVDPHVVQIYGAGEFQGNHFYAMEFVQGTDLGTKIKEGHKFSNQELLDVADQVGTALKAAWKFRITHRDIKPSNILLTEDGTIKVMDFGLARTPDSELTQTNVIMGTASYISPEQANGLACDIRSDLYSLGVVLYELATGGVPFRGDSAQAVVYQHLTRKPVPPRDRNPALPAAFEAIVLKCMEKDPESRYQTPEEFLESIAALRDGVTTAERTVLMDRTDGKEPEHTSPQFPAGAADMTMLGVGGKTGEAPVGEKKKTTDVSRKEGREPSGTLQPISGLLPRERTGAMTVILWVAILAVVAGVGYVAYEWLRTQPPPPRPAPIGGETPVEEPAGGETPVKEPVETDKQAAFRRLMEGGDFEGAAAYAETQFGRASAEWKRADTEIRVAERISEAEEHFAKAEWPGAILKYGKALEMIDEKHRLHASVTKNLKTARFRQKMEDGDYAAAVKLAEEVFGLGTEEFREAERKYRESRYGEWRGKGEAAEAKMDWRAATGAYRNALEVAPEEEKASIGAALSFCRDFADALIAEADGRWADALKLYRRNLGNPRGHGDLLKKAVKDAEARLDEARAAEEKRRMEVFGELLEQIREDYRAARWKEALKIARRVQEMGIGTAEFEAVLKDLEEAAAAPKGFVYVTGGGFSMGTDDGHRVEGPRHNATTKGFYIAVREVTNAEYSAFLSSDAAKPEAEGVPGEPAGKDHTPLGWSDDLPRDEPVRGVDWYDASAYARWAFARLPTEAEWEKAAAYDLQKNRVRKYPWGDEFSKEAEDLSFFGCRGMGSGVFDWVQDEFAGYPGTASDDVHFKRGYRVLRGGIRLQLDAPKNARATSRYWRLPAVQGAVFGIRLVRDPK